MIWTLKELIDHTSCCTTHIKTGDKWVPSRPINWKYEGLVERLRNAWKVFIGRADAFTWPEGQ